MPKKEIGLATRRIRGAIESGSQARESARGILEGRRASGAIGGEKPARTEERAFHRKHRVGCRSHEKPGSRLSTGRLSETKRRGGRKERIGTRSGKQGDASSENDRVADAIASSFPRPKTCVFKAEWKSWWRNGDVSAQEARGRGM